MKVFLATTSSLKSNILKKVGIKHSLKESDFDEESIDEKDVYEYVKKLAKGKADSVYDKIDKGLIIGLDGVCYVDSKILEKPKSIEEAKNFIRLCKNNTSKVIVGLAIINKYIDEVIVKTVETSITLRDISEEDINYYIENEEDAMYVSGFVLEGVISNFLEKIEGSFYNILGVPVEVIYEYINSKGYYLKDLED